MFRLLHGPGDSGSEHGYHCQNPAVIKGWERLAVESLKLKTLDKDVAEWAALVREAIEKRKTTWLRIRAAELLKAMNF